MKLINVEIKARCPRPEAVRVVLRGRDARYAGTDRQIDTYFRVPDGRLKLREGTVENGLIHYRRPDRSGPKRSDVLLCPLPPGLPLTHVLSAALGVLAVVDKTREIYYVENVKFHLDTVAALGSFVEIEAIDADGSIGEARLLEQCQTYLELFGIAREDLIAGSYSDLLLQRGGVTQ
jgi:adenylate cyclase class IV